MSHLVFDATSQEFKTQVLESPLPVLIEFTADWCPPCKLIAPIVHDLAERYAGKMRVGMLDSDIHQDIVLRYGVMGLPTLVLFVGGAPVERIVGYTSREKIEAHIVPHVGMKA